MPRTTVKTAPRKRPRQARARATVEAILEATIHILLSRGYEGTTTIAVAERAGVSVGSLYQYFPNKEALVAALVERHVAELVACITDALDAAPADDPEAAVAAVVRAGIDAHRIHPQLHKILVEQVPRVGRMKTAMNTSKIITEKLAAFLAPHAAHLGGKDPALAAFVVETAVEALTHRAVIERPEMATERQLEAEALELVMGYLFGRGRQKVDGLRLNRSE
ncbi:MAG: TetR/AcrR family transcriptional regulator [Polyangiaceae bacterium]|nr:TetR/AcrR family transcriptional regulator [Polyangiaceae bacterium]